MGFASSNDPHTQQRGNGGTSSSSSSSSSSWGGFIRRKQVDSVRSKPEGQQQQLAKELSVIQLIAIGVGSTIGAGVYVLVGTVAREHSGPALTISFLIAGIAAALSAFCYAELASRCPSAGSAYHYSYICVGEGIILALLYFITVLFFNNPPAKNYDLVRSVAWLIGWALILEYTIGGAAVARGISPNLALLFGGEDSLPVFLARAHIPGLNIVVDPCSAILVFVVTGLLCVGIKESSFVQAIVTVANLCVMVFVIIAGVYLGFKTEWPGYELPSGYFPFGVNGMLAGSATVFFAYIGFDSVASTAEEVKNPQRDLPLGIGIALSMCCTLYMLVSIVIVGLVPYYAMDPDTPISSAFASHGMQWAVYIVTVGAIFALCSTLMGSILPQPRILMAMSRDGLLPPFFSDVNKRTQVPVKSTILTGIGSALLAFFMDVSQLAGLVSVGTLLAFTIVAVSILILRYVPPDEVPLLSSFLESIDSESLHYNSTHESNAENPKVPFVVSSDHCEPLEDIGEASVAYPLIGKQVDKGNDKLGNLYNCSMPKKTPEVELDIKHRVIHLGQMFKRVLRPEELNSYIGILKEQERRRIASWSITFVCIGVLLLTSAASAEFLPNVARFTVCGVGGLLLLCALIALSWIDQDDARHSFGHTGGFVCPFVPILPIACILINVYLMINLGAGTWIRVSVWMVVGVFVYLFYGRTHSLLLDAVYVSMAHADEIYQNSTEYIS